MHRFRILVPVSFGVQSDIALKQAKSIAQKVNAMITCLHVIEDQGLIGGKILSKKMEKKARLESEIKLASKVDAILSGIDGVSYELIVTSGKVHWKILEKTSELEVDLIIMGRSDVSERTKPLLGSNTAKVVERSDIPVLTLRNWEPNSYRHVLVPLDLSAPVGLQLAKTIEIAKLLDVIVTVCAVLHSSNTGYENAYRKRLFEIKHLFVHYGIFCRARLILTEINVAEKLLSCLEKYQPDMMILVTQKESEIEELSIGSNAYELICKSESPVLTVTPVTQKEFYPYSLLTEYISNPIIRYDPNDQLIPTD